MAGRSVNSSGHSLEAQLLVDLANFEPKKEMATFLADIAALVSGNFPGVRVSEPFEPTYSIFGYVDLDFRLLRVQYVDFFGVGHLFGVGLKGNQRDTAHIYIYMYLGGLPTYPIVSKSHQSSATVPREIQGPLSTEANRPDLTLWSARFSAVYKLESLDQDG